MQLVHVLFASAALLPWCVADFHRSGEGWDWYCAGNCNAPRCGACPSALRPRRHAATKRYCISATVVSLLCVSVRVAIAV
jgi:hypothetical protein